jgi:hypothetical protein
MKQLYTWRFAISYFILIFFTPSVLKSQCVAGETGGVVWIDTNRDGIKDASETAGVAGVTVKAYNSSGVQVGSTGTTNASGQYTLGTISTFPIRVEFTTIPSPYQPTFKGSSGMTDVQFVSASSCAVHLGVANPSLGNSCNVSNVILPCYSTTSTQPAIAYFPTTNTGDSPTPTEAVHISDVGALWGAAKQPTQKRLFFSAVLKRHVALGPQGLGGVYMFDYSGGTPVASTSFDITTLTVANAGSSISGAGAINVGSVIRSGGSDYTIPSSGPSVDLDAFTKVGKVGIGDIDMNGNTLWLINMNTAQRSLISIDMSGTSPGTTNRYLIDQMLALGSGAPSCNGTLRPWGLGFGNGKGYLGLECDATGSGASASNLHSYIYSFDPANPATGLTLVADFGMTYLREEAGANGENEWKPWVDTWINDFNGQNQLYTMPIVSDIEIDAAGGMTIALLDRHSFQMGYLNYPALAGYPTTLYPNPNYNPNCVGDCNGDPDCIMYCEPQYLNPKGAYVQGISGGDIIKFCAGSTSGTFVMEGTGGCTVGDLGQVSTGLDDGSKGSLPNIVGGSPTPDGVSGTGEFYWGDYFINPGGGGHEEVTLGSLAYDPTVDRIIATVFDPTNDFYQNGVHWYNPSNGTRTNNYLVVPSLSDAFGKGTGLGDMEIFCLPPTTPTQIGNYVWLDTNKNGVQDPGESPLSNITVTLWKGGTQIASTTTNTNGEYYFSSKSVLGSGWTGTGADTALVASTAYEVHILMSQSGIATPNYALTTANSTTNSGNDLNDSDASLVSGSAVIAFTTGVDGSTNHTYDFGFIAPCIPPTITSVAADTATCSNGFANSDAKIAVRGITGMVKYAYSTNGTTGLYASTATASTADSIKLTGLANPTVATTYTFRIWGVDTTCYNDTTVVLNVTTCPPCGDTFRICQGQTLTVTTQIGLTNIQWKKDGNDLVGETNPSLIISSIGVYTVTGNDANGCAAYLCCPIVVLDSTCCIVPTIASIAADTATCTNGVANNNAMVAVRGIVGMVKYVYGTNGTTNLYYANAIASTADSIKVTGIVNPSVATTYTFRIYSTDSTCYNDTTIILNPSVCPQCAITGTFTQNNCNDNSTTAITTDDYFMVTVSSVSAVNGGTSGKYEVVLNGTTVLNIGGTTYGSSVTVGGAGIFAANGTTTYSLTIRDFDNHTCTTTTFTTTATQNCSVIPCPPKICVPVTVTRIN